ncbi:hypothetical protein [Streptomyces alkaliphilus]|uniref:hypothetical protein n=1 Tax=Streptomyces alkaliphilus TaxID=1472722 RepID=UPI0015F97CDF|nr:hypothetical protein [Streptomyces alkaliphilus]
MELRLPPELMDEVFTALREADIEASECVEFSAGPTLAIIGMSVGPFLWANLQRAIQAICARHKDKKFELTLSSGEKMTADGHSAKDVQLLLKATAELYAQGDRSWQALKNQSSPAPPAH